MANVLISQQVSVNSSFVLRRSVSNSRGWLGTNNGKGAPRVVRMPICVTSQWGRQDCRGKFSTSASAITPGSSEIPSSLGTSSMEIASTETGESFQVVAALFQYFIVRHATVLSEGFARNMIGHSIVDLGCFQHSSARIVTVATNIGQ